MSTAYLHGHHASVLRSHTWRTVENSAPHLIPHLVPDLKILDVGCGPGTITVDPATGKVTVTSLDAPDLTSTRDIAGAVRALGWRVHQHLAATTPRPTPWVQAVVVFWGDFPQRHVHTGRVHYVAGDHLGTWLLEQPATGRLDLDVVTAALRDGALPVGEEAGLPLTRFPLAQTADAHAAVEAGTVGKVLVDVAG